MYECVGEIDEIWLHAEVDGKLSAFVTPPWTGPSLHHELSTKWLDELHQFYGRGAIIVSTGFAPGDVIFVDTIVAL